MAAHVALAIVSLRGRFLAGVIAATSTIAANATEPAGATQPDDAGDGPTFEMCLGPCPGLRGFNSDIRQITEPGAPKLNAAESCLAVQAGHEVVSCVLAQPQECEIAFSNYQTKKESCLNMYGIDVTKAPLNLTYPATTCHLCRLSAGASGKKSFSGMTQWACEAQCEGDPTCSMIDFDATRGLCRTWESCAPAARSDEFGCQWTIYAKPGWEPPPRATRAPLSATEGPTTSSAVELAERTAFHEFHDNSSRMAFISAAPATSRPPAAPRLLALLLLVFTVVGPFVGSDGRFELSAIHHNNHYATPATTTRTRTTGTTTTATMAA